MQIVGYGTGARDLTYDPFEGISGEPGPATLVIADGDDIETVPLAPGTELAYTLGDRHCAGTRHDDGHTACQNDSAPYCDAHTDTWPCARCTGDCELPLESCREEHAVYLAGFAPTTVKVGVTRLWRLGTRLREQGADRAAHIATVSNGRIARQLEAELTADFPDRVPTRQKIQGLNQTVDARTWTRALSAEEPIATFVFDYGLELNDQPVAETIATGTVIGHQGRLLVLEYADTTYAVDLRDLVGYEITPEPTGRELQSSLGSFG
ncbi:MAG: DUF2797 domain-containing protein [Halobacteriales archaeon]